MFRCNKCNGKLFNEEGDIYCINCGARDYPAKPAKNLGHALPIVLQTKGDKHSAPIHVNYPINVRIQSSEGDNLDDS